ncbi:hypothetical protein LshimejAT787_1001810 [Lyophyllum shimeji]|uniref:Uncharacterized protein n=1 Tax=Lyophyllum shimeji TaxID=47721 RepID=A0A9P3PUP1_LYOSH|nr:hypothetical protein LshimejAT787_1001810 [Lyophyllum shimeji]
MLQALWHSPRIWAWFPFLLLLSLAEWTQAQSILHNVTVTSTTPQIVYTPFVCGPSAANTDEQCSGAWRVLDLNGTTLVSTSGPAPDSSNTSIIPQMFFQFRASALHLSTSSLSNATTNITVSNNGTIIAKVFNSSVGMVAVLNLRESEISTVAVTFIPDAFPARLDIGNLVLSVTGDPATSAFLPSMTLPPTASLPAFGTPLPTTSSAPDPGTTKRTLIAQAVGITLGLSFGLTAVAVIAYICWRRRRRRRLPGDGDSEASRSAHSPWPPVSMRQHQHGMNVGADYQVRGGGQHDKTRWFRWP